MIRIIVITIIMTLIVVSFYLLSLGAAYNAGKRDEEQKHTEEKTKLEELLEEYRVKLAEVRIERKFNKKNAN